MRSPPSGGSRRGRKPSAAAPRYHYPMPPHQPVMGPDGRPGAPPLGVPPQAAAAVPYDYAAAAAAAAHYHNPYGYPHQYPGGRPPPPPPGPMAAAAAAAAAAGMHPPPPGVTGVMPPPPPPGQPPQVVPPTPHGNPIAAAMVASHRFQQQQQQQQQRPKVEEDATAGGGGGEEEAKPSAVAWTPAEKQRARLALAQYGGANIAYIVRAVGTRSEAQVRAHLRNVQSQEVAVAAVKMEEMMDGDEKDGASDAARGSAAAKAGESGAAGPSLPSSAASNSSGALLASVSAGGASTGDGIATETMADASGANHGESKDGVATGKRRGGRTKRAPSSALQTVPNAHFDARSMLTALGRK